MTRLYIKKKTQEVKTVLESETFYTIFGSAKVPLKLNTQARSHFWFMSTDLILNFILEQAVYCLNSTFQFITSEK